MAKLRLGHQPVLVPRQLGAGRRCRTHHALLHRRRDQAGHRRRAGAEPPAASARWRAAEHTCCAQGLSARTRRLSGGQPADRALQRGMVGAGRELYRAGPDPVLLCTGDPLPWQSSPGRGVVAEASGHPAKRGPLGPRHGGCGPAPPPCPTAAPSAVAFTPGAVGYAPLRGGPQARPLPRAPCHVAPLNLPLDHPRPARQRFLGSMLPITIDSATGDRLRRIAADHDATLFQLLAAVTPIGCAATPNRTTSCSRLHTTFDRLPSSNRWRVAASRQWCCASAWPNVDLHRSAHPDAHRGIRRDRMRGALRAAGTNHRSAT